MIADAGVLDVALKLSVLPVSGWALWKYAIWQQRRRCPPLDPQPGEVAQLLLNSLAEHPEQWRPMGTGCLFWSADSSQPAAVTLYYSADPPCVRLEGLLKAKLSGVDQARVVAAIQARQDLPKPIVHVPEAAGVVARQVIESLATEPQLWHQFERGWVYFSPFPITHGRDATAKLWVGHGSESVKFCGEHAQGDVDFKFSEPDASYVWKAYKRWRKEQEQRIARRNAEQTRKILTGHKAAAAEQNQMAQEQAVDQRP